MEIIIEVTRTQGATGRTEAEELNQLLVLLHALSGDDGVEEGLELRLPIVDVVIREVVALESLGGGEKLLGISARLGKLQRTEVSLRQSERMKPRDCTPLLRALKELKRR